MAQTERDLGIGSKSIIHDHAAVAAVEQVHQPIVLVSDILLAEPDGSKHHVDLASRDNDGLEGGLSGDENSELQQGYNVVGEGDGDELHVLRLKKRGAMIELKV